VFSSLVYETPFVTSSPGVLQSLYARGGMMGCVFMVGFVGG
jgi:hypothetical protein